MSILHELTDATKTWIELGSEIYGRKFRMPTVSIDLGGACAGKANYTRWMVKYNADLYLRHKVDFLNRTVPHEVAHLIAYSLAGHRVKPHGWEWKNVMHKLGVADDSRTHNYNVEGLANRRARPYIYACRCKEHKLTSVLHNRIQAGNWRRCLKCGARVEFVRMEMVA